MTAFIVNAEQGVVDELHLWIADRAAAGPPDEQAAFDQKWAALQTDDHKILRALVEEGGHNVKEASIRRRLIKNGLDSNAASNILRTRRAAMSQENLVRLQHNIYDGDEISLHPAWEWYIRRAVS